MINITAQSFCALLEKENINRGELQNLAVNALIKSGKTVATAESCTGGLVSKRITEVSGASAAFECGVCSYANRIKHKLLGVSEETLATVGAVSPETAAQMAEGVRALAGADFGVSTTGIAGPTGGTKEKPVGLVFLSVSRENSSTVIKALFGDAEDCSREEIRRLASDAALYFLLKELS